MKNFKRAAAMIAVILLLGVFCLPMIFAVDGADDSGALFRGALGAAFLLPILLYIFWMVYRIFGKKKPGPERDIENIVFDVGQVLVTYDWEGLLKSFDFPKEKYDKIAGGIFGSRIWHERDKGLLTEEEYVQQFVDAMPEYETDIRAIMCRTPECVTVKDYSETWLRYLKSKGYHLYVLSNYGAYMLEHNRGQMNFLEHIDGEIFSCNVGDVKPNASIYQTLLKRFGLKAEKCIFLDDMEENCAAAGKLGFHTIQFHDFKQAAAELEALGVE